MQRLCPDRRLGALTARVYAVVSDDGDQYLRLRDLQSDETHWVRADTSVRPGTVLDGVVEGDPIPRLVTRRCRGASTLAIGVAESLEPTAQSLWRDRDPSTDQVTGVVDPPGGSSPTEVHVSAPGGADPATLRARLLTGAVSFEPWYDCLPELETGAIHLTAVMPESEPRVAVYATPATSASGLVRAQRARLVDGGD